MLVHKSVFVKRKISEIKYSYKQLRKIAKFLRGKIEEVPKIAIICGSGLGSLADAIENPIKISYDEIPDFPQSTVQGHEGCLIFGSIAEVPVVVMKGRFHFYEGYPLWKVTMPVKIFKLIGCSFLIVTNAAGSVNKHFKVGDIMLIKDHIDWPGFGGNSPLRGPQEMPGERFPSMNKCYDKDLRKQSVKIARRLGLEKKLRQGVYGNLAGPTYESVAEMRMLTICGVDSVGMSTVPEVVVARQLGLTVFAFSLITNKGILDYGTVKKPNHLEVLEAAKAMEEPLREFVKRMIKYMGDIQPCTCGIKLELEEV